jgi:hypothetical protein
MSLYICVTNPRHLQERRGYSLPAPEVLGWLKTNLDGEYDVEPYSSGCDIHFSSEAAAAFYKLTWFGREPEAICE